MHPHAARGGQFQREIRRVTTHYRRIAGDSCSGGQIYLQRSLWGGCRLKMMVAGEACLLLCVLF